MVTKSPPLLEGRQTDDAVLIGLGNGILTRTIVEVQVNLATKCSPRDAVFFKKDFLAMSIPLEYTMSVGLVRLGSIRYICSVRQLSMIIFLKVPRIIVNGMMSIDVGINVVTNIRCKKGSWRLVSSLIVNQ